MELCDFQEFRICQRCSKEKRASEFINSRGVVGKNCAECLSKRRKYLNSNRCEHSRIKTACKWCNGDDSIVKAPRGRALIKEVILGEDGSIELEYDKPFKEKLTEEIMREKLLEKIAKKEKEAEKLREELVKKEEEIEKLKTKILM
jgi:hypothetical protein